MDRNLTACLSGVFMPAKLALKDIHAGEAQSVLSSGGSSDFPRHPSRRAVFVGM